MKTKFFFTVFCSLFILFFSYYIVFAKVTIETVDYKKNVGSRPSLVLDSKGRPHISYYDVTNHDLKYATKKDDVWQINKIASKGDVGDYSSIALDSKARPHIAYHDGSGAGSLRYTWRASKNNWRKKLLDDSPGAGLYVSHSIDKDNNSQIVYSDGESVYSIILQSNQVSKNVIDQVGFPGVFDVSSAMYKKLANFVAYSDATKIYFANPEGGLENWQVMESGNADSSSDVSLAIDKQGNIHLSYFGYGKFNYGASINEKNYGASFKARKAHHLSSVADAKNLINLSYYAYNSKSGNYYLQYAKKKSLKSDKFSKIKIENLGSSTAFGGTSISLDKKGRVHIAYYHPRRGDLMYAIVE